MAGAWHCALVGHCHRGDGTENSPRDGRGLRQCPRGDRPASSPARRARYPEPRRGRQVPAYRHAEGARRVFYLRGTRCARRNVAALPSRRRFGVSALFEDGVRRYADPQDLLRRRLAGHDHDRRGRTARASTRGRERGSAGPCLAAGPADTRQPSSRLGRRSRLDGAHQEPSNRNRVARQRRPHPHSSRRPAVRDRADRGRREPSPPQTGPRPRCRTQFHRQFGARTAHARCRRAGTDATTHCRDRGRCFPGAGAASTRWRGSPA